MEKSGVSPAALGSGYVIFFLYSVVLGIAAIVLAFIVGARQEKLLALEPANPPGEPAAPAA
jgi:PAT family beta-lactamase induction signal transducer AmpG